MVRPQFHALLTDLITIEGSNFGTNAKKTFAEFGGYFCAGNTATDTKMTCKMDLSVEPPIRTFLHLKFTRQPYGTGLLKTQIEYNNTIVFQHVVNDISPKQGALGRFNFFSEHLLKKQKPVVGKSFVVNISPK